MPAAKRKQAPAPQIFDTLFHRLRQHPYETPNGKLILIGPTIVGNDWEVSVTLNDGSDDPERLNVVNLVIQPRDGSVQFRSHSSTDGGVTFDTNGLKLADLGKLLIETEKALRQLGMREVAG